MAESRLDIVIGQRSEGNALARAQSEMSALKNTAQDVGQEMRTALAFAGVGAGVLSLGQLQQALVGNVRSGIEFNAVLETAQLGIAAILKQFDDSGKIGTFDEALKQAGDSIDYLKTKAIESPATLKALIAAYQGTAGAAASAGMATRQHVDLIVLMSQALKGLGIRDEQILQESRALMTGNITEDAMAARILGITKAQVEDAKQQGQLYEFLTGKLSAFGEAGKRGGQTLEVMLSNLTDKWDQLRASLTEPAFEELKSGVDLVLARLDDPEFAQALLPLGEAATDVIKHMASLADFLLKNSDIIVQMGKGAFTLGAAFATLKIAQLIVDFGRKAFAITAAASAIQRETVAIEANTAAQIRNNQAKAIAAGQAGVATVVSADAMTTGKSVVMGGSGVAAAGSAFAMSNAVPMIMAAITGYAIGSMIDERGNPLRGAAGKLLGTYDGTFSSAKDERQARSLMGDYNKEFSALSQKVLPGSQISEQDRLELVTRLQQKLAELNQMAANATNYERGTKREIAGQVAAYATLLSLAERLNVTESDRQKKTKDNSKFLADFSAAGSSLSSTRRSLAFNDADSTGKISMLEEDIQTLRSNLSGLPASNKPLSELSDLEKKNAIDRLNTLSLIATKEQQLGEIQKQQDKEKVEKAAKLELFEIETQIAEARARGDLKAAESLEERLKTTQAIKELEAAGLSPEAAASLANRRTIAERVPGGVVAGPQETDRLQQMGLFFGTTAQQLNMARQHLDVLQKIEANTRNSGSGSPQAIVR